MTLKEARERAGIPVLRVALETGVSIQAVYQWERGETTPTAKKLPILARLYNCSIDDLLPRDEYVHHAVNRISDAIHRKDGNAQ